MLHAQAVVYLTAKTTPLRDTSDATEGVVMNRAEVFKAAATKEKEERKERVDMPVVRLLKFLGYSMILAAQNRKERVVEAARQRRAEKRRRKQEAAARQRQAAARS